MARKTFDYAGGESESGETPTAALVSLWLTAFALLLFLTGWVAVDGLGYQPPDRLRAAVWFLGMAVLVAWLLGLTVAVIELREACREPGRRRTYALAGTSIGAVTAIAVLVMLMIARD
jgi:hypothetical protein